MYSACGMKTTKTENVLSCAVFDITYSSLLMGLFFWNTICSRIYPLFYIQIHCKCTGYIAGLHMQSCLMHALSAIAGVLSKYFYTQNYFPTFCFTCYVYKTLYFWNICSFFVKNRLGVGHINQNTLGLHDLWFTGILDIFSVGYLWAKIQNKYP